MSPASMKLLAESRRQGLDEDDRCDRRGKADCGSVRRADANHGSNARCDLECGMKPDAQEGAKRAVESEHDRVVWRHRPTGVPAPDATTDAVMNAGRIEFMSRVAPMRVVALVIVAAVAFLLATDATSVDGMNTPAVGSAPSARSLAGTADPARDAAETATTTVEQAEIDAFLRIHPKASVSDAVDALAMQGARLGYLEGLAATIPSLVDSRVDPDTGVLTVAISSESARAVVMERAVGLPFAVEVVVIHGSAELEELVRELAPGADGADPDGQFVAVADFMQGVVVVIPTDERFFAPLSERFASDSRIEVRHLSPAQVVLDGCARRTACGGPAPVSAP